MIRKCCHCQITRPATHLIRLYADDSGALRPSSSRPKSGRSAWMCWSIDCAIGIQQKSKKTMSSLRQQVHTEFFFDAVQSWLWTESVSLLKKIHRSGLMSSQKQAVSGQTVQYWITWSGEFAKMQKIEYFKPDKNSIPSFRISLNIHREAMNTNAIGIQRGKMSNLLQQRLQLLEQLTLHCSRLSTNQPS